MLSPASRRTRASSGKERTDVEIGFVEVLFDGRHLRLARPGWGRQRAVGLSARFFRGRLGMGSRGRRHLPAHVWLRSCRSCAPLRSFTAAGFVKRKQWPLKTRFTEIVPIAAKRLSFPSCIRGFDSLRPLQRSDIKPVCRRAAMGANVSRLRGPVPAVRCSPRRSEDAHPSRYGSSVSTR
jgi:hypothetical protein